MPSLLTLSCSFYLLSLNITLALVCIFLRFVLPEFQYTREKKLSLTSAALSQASTVDAKASPCIMRTTYRCCVAVTYTFLAFLQRSEMTVYKAKLLGYFSLTCSSSQMYM